MLGLITIPKSPYHTNRLLAGLIPSHGWLSDREADVFRARLAKANEKNQDATLHIKLADMSVTPEHFTFHLRELT